MNMDWHTLKEVLGDSDQTQEDTLQLVWANAEGIIADVVSQAYRPVPQTEVDRWTLELAMELKSRYGTASGGSLYNAYQDGSGVPVRGARDPLTQLWPSIRRYVLPL